MSGKPGVRGRLLALLCTLVAVAACSTTPEPEPHKPPLVRAPGAYKLGAPYVVDGRRYVPRFEPDYEEVGIASWYGEEFRGRRTANGEIFDPRRLTAAHPTLPLPSLVEVTNLENGRSIRVRVNDRGPFYGGRIIDLSEAAAAALGFREQGIARVRVRFLALADARGPRPAWAKASGRVASARAARACRRPVFVQVGAFDDAARARRQAARLRALGPVQVEGGGGDGLLRVRLGPYAEARRAERILQRLRAMGYGDAFLYTPPPGSAMSACAGTSPDLEAS